MYMYLISQLGAGDKSCSSTHIYRICTVSCLFFEQLNIFSHQYINANIVIRENKINNTHSYCFTLKCFHRLTIVSFFTLKSIVHSLQTSVINLDTYIYERKRKSTVKFLSHLFSVMF